MKLGMVDFCQENGTKSHFRGKIPSRAANTTSWQLAGSQFGLQQWPSNGPAMASNGQQPASNGFAIGLQWPAMASSMASNWQPSGCQQNLDTCPGLCPGHLKMDQNQVKNDLKIRASDKCRENGRLLRDLPYKAKNFSRAMVDPKNGH